MNLKELLSEKGVVLRDGVLLDTDDVKHLSNYTNESHGELIRALEEFYEMYHQRVYNFQIELFEEFLEHKSNESNGLN
jgi:hypothetical protein